MLSSFTDAGTLKNVRCSDENCQTMKNNSSAQEVRLRELGNLVRNHNELYYRKAKPVISDQQYDSLKREMEKLQSEIDPLGLFQSTESSTENEEVRSKSTNCW